MRLASAAKLDAQREERAGHAAGQAAQAEAWRAEVERARAGKQAVLSTASRAQGLPGGLWPRARPPSASATDSIDEEGWAGGGEVGDGWGVPSVPVFGPPLMLLPTTSRAHSSGFGLFFSLITASYVPHLGALATPQRLRESLSTCSTVAALLALLSALLFLQPGGATGATRTAVGSLSGFSLLASLLQLLLCSALGSTVGHLQDAVGAGVAAAEAAPGGPLHAFVRANAAAFALPWLLQRLSLLALAASTLLIANALYGVGVAAVGAALFGAALMGVWWACGGMLDTVWNFDCSVDGWRAHGEPEPRGAAPREEARPQSPPPPPARRDPMEAALAKFADMVDPFGGAAGGGGGGGGGGGWSGMAPTVHTDSRTDLINHGQARMRAAEQAHQPQARPPPASLFPSAPTPRLSATPSVQELMAAKRQQEEFEMTTPPPVAASGRPLSVQEMMAQKRQAEGLYVPGGGY